MYHKEHMMGRTASVWPCIVWCKTLFNMGVDGGSRCRMLIIRKGNVALSNFRNTPVALSNLRYTPVECR